MKAIPSPKSKPSTQTALCRFGVRASDGVVREEDVSSAIRNVTSLHRHFAVSHPTVLCGTRGITTQFGIYLEKAGFGNLISNGLKYSPSGGNVSVDVSCGPGWAIVKVVDQGIGIASEDLQHIFEPFRRISATREAIPGVGLGLSVSRRIAKAHRGSIEVSSIRGAGSTFSLRLPLQLT